MLVKNALSKYTKVDKETLIGKQVKVVDLVPVTTENGRAMAAIMDDNTFTYVPSADVDFAYQLLADADSINEIREKGIMVTITAKTSKSNRTYYVMFE